MLSAKYIWKVARMMSQTEPPRGSDQGPAIPAAASCDHRWLFWDSGANHKSSWICLRCKRNEKAFPDGKPRSVESLGGKEIDEGVGYAIDWVDELIIDLVEAGIDKPDRYRDWNHYRELLMERCKSG